MHAGSGDAAAPAHDVDGTRSRRALDLCVCGHDSYDHAPACSALTALDKRCYCPRFMPHPQPVGLHRTPEPGTPVQPGKMHRLSPSRLAGVGLDLGLAEDAGSKSEVERCGSANVVHARENATAARGAEEAEGNGPRHDDPVGPGIQPLGVLGQDSAIVGDGLHGPASYREKPALWTVNVWSDGNTTGTGPHGRVWWNVDVHCGAVYRFAIYGSATREQAERDGIAFVRREDDRASITIHRKAPRPSLLSEMADANWEGDPMEALMLMRTLTEDVRDRVLFELKRREETWNEVAQHDGVLFGVKDLEDEFLCRVFAALEGGAL